jgi:hypothetical protein
MTLSELKDYILDQLVAPVNQVQKVINVFNAVVDYFTGNTVSTIIPDWTNALTFQTDGTDAGKFCIYPDTNGKKRIFETKVDDNINNAPPSGPTVTENAYWIEISQAGSSAIVEWEAKLYGAGLVIVFHNHSVDGPGFYLLTEATRPFSSANIETEITAGKWLIIANSSPGGGGPGIADKYANIAALLADQGDQEEDALYFVLDASTDATVDSGWALYQKLNTTAGLIGDYRKLTEQESLDVIFNVLGTTLTGYSTGAGTLSASDTILQAFNKIGYFIANIAATVRAVLLTGYAVGSNVALAATDTILEAFGKLQAQINANTTAIAGKQDTLVSGTNIKTVNSTSLLGSGNISITATLGVLFPNVLFVSPTGDNGTAVTGDFSKPYTPSGAAAMAISGDIICFLPGAYTINSNIAVNGVSYTTIGGKATITVNSASGVVWDYNALTNTGITSDISIIGDFDFVLNATGSTVLKLHTGTVNRRIFFEFTRANVILGNAVITTPTAMLSSHFQGSITLSGTGYAIVGGGSTCDGKGSIFELIIYSTSTVNEAINWNISTGGLDNCIFDVAYYNTTVGGKGFQINSGSSTTTKCTGRISIVQPTGAISSLCGGEYDLTVHGGTVVLLGTAKFSIAGWFYNCSIQGNSQIQAVILGYYKSCTFVNNQCNQFVLDGHSTDCTLTWASSQITTLKGCHYDIQGSGGSLIIDGDVKWLTGQYFAISYNRTMKVTAKGRMVGNVNGAGIITSVGLPKCEIYGEIKNNNTGADAHCLYHYNANATADYIFKLKGAILVTKGVGAGAKSIYTLSTYTQYVQMLGQSFSNAAQGGAGTITYTIGASTDLIVDTDLDIEDIAAP